MRYVRLPSLLLLILSLLNTACIRFYTKPGEAPADSKQQYHVVEAGETLYSLAFDYGHDYREVANWNNIRPPYTIYPKQKLRVVPPDNETVEVKQIPRASAKATPKWQARPAPPVVAKTTDAPPKWRWPVEGKILSTFSFRDPGRRGIDIAGRKGQAVYAAAEGRVVYKGNGLRGYGNLIILKHNDTYFSAYAHNQRVVVKENEIVKSGQQIADMGDTGSERVMLHFEIRRDGKPVDPLNYLPKRR